MTPVPKSDVNNTTFNRKGSLMTSKQSDSSSLGNTSGAARRGRRTGHSSADFREELKRINQNPFVQQSIPDVEPVQAGDLSVQQADYLMSFFRHNFLFEGVPWDVLLDLARHVDMVQVKATKAVMMQGDTVGVDDCVYAIANGRVRVTIEAATQRFFVQTTGAVFGELGALFGTDRNASIHALTDVQLMAISRRTLLAFQDKLPAVEGALFLRRLTILQGLADSQILELVTKAVPVCYKKGHFVIRYGDKARDLFIIKKGRVDILNAADQVLTSMGEGQLLGQRTVVTGKTRTASCRAAEAIELFRIEAQHFQLLSNPILDWVIDSDSIMSVLRAPQHAMVTDAQAERMMDTFTKKTLQRGEELLREGQLNNCLFIVRKGSLLGDIHEEDGYQWCGSLTEQEAKSVVALSETLVLVIAIEAAPTRPRQSIELVRHHDLEVLSRVGVGSIGCVELVRSKQTKELFCVKKVHLEGALSGDDVELPPRLLLKEGRIMRQVNSPFCVKLHDIIEDDNQQVRLLMSWVPGGELWGLLQKQGGFDEPTCRFYAACIVIALDHLHRCNICYRDLKPENVLIGADGYPVLADFGFAKHVSEGLTFSLVGTITYSSPEILSRKGHDFKTDMWSLGILLYEMLCNSTPFDDSEGDAFALYRKTTSGRFSIPQFLSQDSISLIQALLQPNPDDRPSAASVKNHVFFKSIDWQALEQKKLQPPFVPKLASEDDVSCFTDSCFAE